MNTQKNIFSPDKLSSFAFYISILLFIIAFNFAHNPPSGWYQQFLPNIGGRQISDIFFLDSLTGWAVTPYRQQQDDTAFVLKTTNGGDNWVIQNSRTANYVGFERIYFLNNNTGFVCGTNDFFSGYTGLSKSTDGGLNWISLNVPDPFAQFNDMSVLNEDTIWLASNSTGGGVFRTTNGGTNWIRQYSGNPDKIYMFNSRIGFIANNEFGISTKKTIDGGFNWFTILNEGCSDIYFADSLTGWKARGDMKKTTNGGLNWVTQILPSGGNIAISEIIKFSNINSDTLWGVGAVSNLIRGLIYISTNGGTTWNYQLPDTSIHIPRYYHVQFVNKLNGWAYSVHNGVHTKVGGDTTFYTGLVQQVSTIPKDFTLHQNYPNPFNPRTIIPFSLKKSAYVKLTAYDIIGKEVQKLVEGRYEAGEYEVDFMGKFSASGVYFYHIVIHSDRLFIDTGKEIFSDSKTMILIK